MATLPPCHKPTASELLAGSPRVDAHGPGQWMDTWGHPSLAVPWSCWEQQLPKAPTGAMFPCVADRGLGKSQSPHEDGEGQPEKSTPRVTGQGKRKKKKKPQKQTPQNQSLDQDYCTKELNKQCKDFLQVIEPAQWG